MNKGSNIFDMPIGVLRVGTIHDTSNMDRGIINVQLKNGKTGTGKPEIVSVKIPQILALNNGLFLGAKPVRGTPVIIGGADHVQDFYFVSYYNEDTSKLPSMNDGEILIQSNDNTKVSIEKYNIKLGNYINNINLNTDRKILTTVFDHNQIFTQASRKIDGIIKREPKAQLENIDLNSRLYDSTYDYMYNIICLDPSIDHAPSSKVKNPAFVENREIVYEFEDYADISDDLEEKLKYGKSSENKKYFYPNRRKTKTDVFSLSLSYPNYLIETIKGTGVDIFGNLLDLNRAILPIGKGQNTLSSSKSIDKEKSYEKIKEIERKGIAYHFEINARKDFTKKRDIATAEPGGEDAFTGNQQLFSDLFGYNEKFPNADYGRLRSKFFVDIDKEGQLKVNVPASSESGNIPFLLRYENYSSLSDKDNNNKNKIISNEDDGSDILHDSFACPKIDLNTTNSNTSKIGRFLIDDGPGSINIKQNDSVIALKDRIYKKHIKHGMPYHDVLATCYAHQKNDYLDYVYDESLKKNLYLDIPLLKNIVSDTIIVGENAGGRSGSLNFDGSLDLSIGANSVDRQSLWLDTAGGIIGNIGRDSNSRSAAINMNGDVFIQIGGRGVVGDSRFVKQNNGQIGAVLDLRIFNNGGNVTMIRVDDNGITLMTPGNLNIHSAGEIKMTASSIDINAENCLIMGRQVLKGDGGIQPSI